MSQKEISPFDIDEYLLEEDRKEESADWEWLLFKIENHLPEEDDEQAREKWERLLERERVWGASILPDFDFFNQ